VGLGSVILGRDLAIDLGTSNTLVFARNRGIVIDEPSVVSWDLRSGSLVAAGIGAMDVLGHSPGAPTAVRPLSAGLVADFAATEALLRDFMTRANPRAAIARSRVLICVPSGTTDVERRTVEDAGYSAGARKVFLLEEPMAAAIGAGLDVFGSTGKMIVDIGGGTTEVALIAHGHAIVSVSAAIGGDRCDQAISDHFRSKHALQMGDRTCERIKISLGSAFPREMEPEAELVGLDVPTGLPRSQVVAASEIRAALADPISEIVTAVRSALDKVPPDLASDVMEGGILMSGGGSLLRGVAERLASETHLEVKVAEDPLRSVVIGAGRVMDNVRALDSLLVARPRRN
jgi:rod shape-determining protein MreB